jgi:ABC-type transporter Mla subunit MlaD
MSESVTRQQDTGPSGPDLTREVERILGEKLPGAVASELDRQGRGNGADKAVLNSLEEVSAALRDIAGSEKKQARHAKASAFGNVLLFIAFAVVFVLITPGLFSLLSNVNGMMSGLNTTIADVDTLLVTANDTVTGINGVLDSANQVVADVNTGVNNTFDSVNTLLGTVNDEVTGIGTAVDDLNEAVGQIQKVVDDNAGGVNKALEEIAGLDYDSLNRTIANAEAITTDVAGVSGELGQTIDGVNTVVDNANTAVSGVNDTIAMVQTTIQDTDKAVQSVNDTVTDTGKVVTTLGTSLVTTTKVINQAMDTINAIDVDEITSAISDFQKAAEGVNSVTDELTDSVSTMNDTVQKQNGYVEATVDQSQKIDYEGLNDSIDVLKDSAKQLSDALKQLNQ